MSNLADKAKPYTICIILYCHLPGTTQSGCILYKAQIVIPSSLTKLAM